MSRLSLRRAFSRFVPHASPRGANRGRGTRKRQLRFDPLEARRLLAVTATFEDGNLNVLGTTGADDIEITFEDQAGINFVVVKEGTTTRFNDVRAAEITTITVDALAGADTIDLANVTEANGFDASLTTTLLGGDDNDTITGSGLSDSLVGGKGDDSLTGGAGDDTYGFARPGGENLGSDTLTEGTGGANDARDTLDFSEFEVAVSVDIGNSTAISDVGKVVVTLNDTAAFEGVTGSTAADTLTGNSRDNVLEGGQGNDSLIGGAGDDTYVFTRQQTSDDLGDDVISEGSSSNDTGDTLDFSGFLEAVTVNLATTTSQDVGGSSGMKLDLDLNDANSIDDSIVVENVVGGVGNDSITGNTRDNILEGGRGNDSLTGGTGADSYVFSRTGSEDLGDDTLTEGIVSNDTNDVLDFRELGAAVIADLGSTIAIDLAGTVKVTLNDTTAFERLFGGDLADNLTGNSRDNVISGGAGDDTFEGGLGDDTLVGAAGDDRYVFAGGDSNNLGDDSIHETSFFLGEGVDTLDFSAFGAAIDVDLSVAVTLQNVHANLDLTLDGATVFENVIGSSENDTITGNSVDNILEGGLGNDSLSGGTGTDTYVFARTGSEDLGDDTLTEGTGGSNDEGDTLDFAQFGAAVTVDIGSLTAIDLMDEVKVTLNDTSAFEGIIGSTSADTLTGNTRDNILEGGRGNDSLTGGTGDDTYVFARTASEDLGDDTLTEDTVSNDEGDTLDFSRYNAPVTVDLNSTTPTNAFPLVNVIKVTLTSAIAFEGITGSPFNDTLIGNSRNSVLDGGAGDDTLIGGEGDDSLTGGTGTDTYVFARDGSEDLGDDTLTEGTGASNDEGDTLSFAGFGAAVAVDISSLTAIDSAGEVKVTLNDTAAFEGIVGTTLADTLTGNARDNILEGGQDNDSLIGGAGDDTYVFTRQQMSDDLGDDVISEGSSSNDTGDTLDFSGFLEAVTVNLATTTSQDVGGASGTKLDLDLNDADAIDDSIVVENVVGGVGNDSITGNTRDNILEGGRGNDSLSGGAGDDTYRFSRPTVEDLGDDVLTEGTVSNDAGDTLDFAQFGAAVTVDIGSTTAIDVNGDVKITLNDAAAWENVIGSTFDDVLIGNERNNLLQAGEGDDSLTGGLGHDSLEGGAGDDSYLFPRTSIEDLGADTITEGTAGANDEDDELDFSQFGAGVTVDLGDTTQQIVLLDKLRLTITVADSLENIVGTDFGDTLTGNPRDNLIESGMGNDLLSGQSGEDTLFGGLGNDTLDGGNNRDTLEGGRGDDSLDGGQSDDRLIFARIGDEDLGSDTLAEVAGQGFADLVDFSAFGAGVTVDIGLTTEQHVAVDRLKLTISSAASIENIVGSAFDDDLTGNNSVNRLTGGLGNDTLAGGKNNDFYLFPRALGEDLGSDTINEMTGVDNSLGDTLDFSNFNAAFVVDISLTQMQTISDGRLAIELNAGDVIENVDASFGPAVADHITGNSRNNVLSGGRGDDTILGGGGDDSLKGGRGRDSLVGGDGNDTLEGGEGKDILEGGAGNDLLKGSLDTSPQLENLEPVTLRGGDGNDTLVGTAGNDLLEGGLGDDSLAGGAGDDTYLFPRTTNEDLGADTIDEGTGASNDENDTLDFSQFGDSGAMAGVSVDLSNTTQQPVLSTKLRLTITQADSLENIIGTDFGDTLTGNSRDNLIEGGTGDDSLTGGTGTDTYVFARTGSEDLGDDTLTEGTGGSNDAGDTLDFSQFGAAVTVDISSLTAIDLTDEVKVTLNDTAAFEGIIGTDFDDSLTGNSQANIFEGGLGDDSLVGGTGDDTYVFARSAEEDLGSDTITEGSGGSNDAGDKLDFLNFGSQVVVDLGAAAAQAVNSRLTVTLGGADVIEHVVGSKFADTIIGNSRPNDLQGEGGADSISGGDGADTLDGGLNDDTLEGGLGDDSLTGGQANDRFVFARSGSEDLGDDTLDEGTGGDNDDADVLDFGAFGAGVTVDIGSLTAIDLMNEVKVTLNDTTAFEYVVGSALADTLTGNSRDNSLQGGAGNDTITAVGGQDTLEGGLGDDSLVGGAGNDIYVFARTGSEDLGDDTIDEGTGGSNDDDDELDFSQFGAGMAVDLGDTTQQTVLLNGLRLTITQADSLENIIGTDFNDTLTGNARENELEGGAGDDTLAGREDRDHYIFVDGADRDLGSDTLNELDNAQGSNIDFLRFDGFGDGITVNLGTTSQQTVHANLKITLNADDRFEQVRGTRFDDVITGNGANNFVNAGDGRDVIVGLGGNDTLAGNAGDDTLEGGAGDDSLFGGFGADTFMFDRAADDESLGIDRLMADSNGRNDAGDTLDFSGFLEAIQVDLSSTAEQFVDAGQTDLKIEIKLETNDFVLDPGDTFENVIGSDSDDTIIGNARDNIFEGGRGNDSLSGGGGSDTYVFPRTTDEDLGADTIDEGTGASNDENDTLDFSQFGDSIVMDGVSVDLRNTSQQTILTGKLLLTINQGGGLENVIGTEFDDIIIGNDRANLIKGGDGDDNIIGEGGDDTVLGQLGGDSITGGDGEDLLIGSAGNDSLTGGDGQDSLFGSTGNDTLVGGNHADSLQGNEGADVLVAGSDADTVKGGEGDDTISGDAGDDLLIGDAGNDNVLAGDGDDTVFGGAGNDTLSGGGDDDFLFGDDDADSLVGDAGNDTIFGGAGDDTLAGGTNDDWLEGQADNDSLAGGDHDDTLLAAAGNDTLEGGLGTDQLEGASGNDVYRFAGSGDLGHDTLIENTGSNDDAGDMLDFASFGAGVTVDLADTSLQVVHANLDITLNDDAAFENATGSSNDDTIEGNSDPNLLIGGAGADGLDGAEGNDTLEGGQGNDDLFGRSGDDVYFFADGDSTDLGEDSIFEATPAGGSGVDTLDFSAYGAAVDVDLADTLLQNVHLNLDLILDGASDVENVIGSTGNDTIAGNSVDNLLQGGGGNDSITGGGGDDTLDGDAGNDTLDGGGSDDSLIGGDGADSLVGGDGVDTLEGQAGDDTMVGGAGLDVYFFAGGESLGSDTLTELTGGSNDNGDRLDFSSSSLGVTVDLSDTLLQNVNANLSITLNDASAFENVVGSDLADDLTGNDRDNSLTGGSGNDTLEGGLGNDSLTGAAGDDRYVFAGGDSNDLGEDSIFEAATPTGGAGVDTLDFSAYGAAVDVDLADTLLQNVHANLDLVLDDATVFENVVGSSLNDTIAGNSVDNILTGGGGNDSISGGGAADTLQGEAGDDTLVGGAGNDVLEGGDGVDALDGVDGDDTLEGGLGNDALIGRSGDDVYVFADGDMNNLGTDTLFEGFTPFGGSGTDTLDFSAFGAAIDVDLSVAITSQIVHANLSLTLDGATVFENVIGSSANDTITGNSVGNVLQGGAGNDTLSGADNADSLVGGDGADVLNGGDGNDTLDGGADDDFLSGELGDDTLAGGSGDDLYLFSRNSTMLDLGHDTIDEAGGTGAENDAGDLLHFASFLDPIDVDLADDTKQDIDGFQELELTLLNDDSIEFVLGTSGNDTIAGNSRDNVLFGTDGADSISGADGDDFMDGGAGDDTLAGGAGNDIYSFDRTNADDLGSDTLTEGTGISNDDVDILDFSNSLDPSEMTLSVVADLSSTSAQTVITGKLTLTLNDGSAFEGILGSVQSDTLAGNSRNNFLAGREGNDSLNGGLGDDLYIFSRDASEDLGSDTITEGTGVNNDDADALTFENFGAAVTVDLSDATLQSVHADLDITLNDAAAIEGVLGTAFADDVSGNSRDNQLRGGAGNDTLRGAAGNDSLEGGAGNDSLDGDADDDTLEGGLGDDLLIGRAGDDVYVFADGASNDLGTDTLFEDSTPFGGAGDDTLDFSAFGDGIDIDLSVAVTSQMVHTNLDIVLDSASVFENVIGSAGDDTILGNSLDNSLTGGAGDDTLEGRGGDDTLDGGSGNDTFVFDRTSIDDLGTDSVIDVSGASSDAFDVLDFSNFDAGIAVDLSDDDVAGQIVLLNKLNLKLAADDSIEVVYGSDQNDTVIGNARDNVLLGDAGADGLTGADGRDLLIGGAGSDTLKGGRGDDFLVAAKVELANRSEALAAVMAEWTSERRYHLRYLSLNGLGDSGSLNGNHFLRPGFEVINDTAVDELHGDADKDVFMFDFLANDEDRFAEAVDWEFSLTSEESPILEFREMEINTPTFNENVWTPNNSSDEPVRIDMPNSDAWLRTLAGMTFDGPSFFDDGGNRNLTNDPLFVNNQVSHASLGGTESSPTALPLRARSEYLELTRAIDEATTGGVLNPNLVVGNYHSGLDVRTFTSASYTRRSLPLDWFSPDQILINNNDTGVDYRDPEARDLFIRGFVHNNIASGLPLVFMDNGQHPSKGGRFTWDVTSSFYREMAAALHERGIRLMTNVGWGIDGQEISASETDDIDVLFAPPSMGLEAPDGIMFEQPLGDAARRTTESIDNALSSYQKILAGADPQSIADNFHVVTLAEPGDTEFRNREREFLAGFALLHRQAGDQIFQGSDYRQDVPQWADWPGQLGNPLGAAEVIQVGSGFSGDPHIYRRIFENGVLEVSFHLELDASGNVVSPLGTSTARIY